MGIGEVGEKLRRGTVQVWNGRNACGSGVIRDAAGVLLRRASNAAMTAAIWPSSISTQPGWNQFGPPSRVAFAWANWSSRWAARLASPAH